MKDMTQAYWQIKKWLFLLLSFHLIVWTFVPFLVRHNLPMDALEGATWGQQLEWGYDKNPFLNGWLTALAVYLDQHSGLLIYFFSQLSVIICMGTMWALGKKILTPFAALIAVMLLEGIKYFHLNSIDFNDNTLELSLWALTIYFFYCATHPSSTANKRLIAWIATGFFAALGMMAKYYTLALLTALFLFLIYNKDARNELKTTRPYLGLVLFTLVIIPHIVWLFFHEFITIQYVFNRTATIPSWTNHFFYPTQFALDQILAFFPVLFLFAILWDGKQNANLSKLPHHNFNSQFLFFAGLGPFLLTLLLSLLLGIKLRAGWGMPLLSLWTILLIYYLSFSFTLARIKCFFASVFMSIVLLLGAYSYILMYSTTPSSANFPGKEIAQRLTQAWQDTYHTELKYVAGFRWISGNIGFYSSHHPAVFMEWNQKHAPWINIDQMKKEGAIFVWDITNNETLPAEVSNLFPGVILQTPIEFAWIRTTYLAPIKIGYAFLPPARISPQTFTKRVT